MRALKCPFISCTYLGGGHVEFLASDEAGAITGAFVNVTGGTFPS
jgi:hypothetical protein